MVNLSELFVAIVEVIIFLIMIRSRGWGKKYAPAVAGYTGFLITMSKSISLGIISTEYLMYIVTFCLIGLLVVYMVATNFRARVGPLRAIYKFLVGIGAILAIISPIIYAMIV